MKHVRYFALLSVLAVLSPLGAFARDKNHRSVDIPNAMLVEGVQLAPGHYNLQIQGAGPDVQVTFLQNGKTVGTVPGKLTNDKDVDGANFDFRHARKSRAAASRTREVTVEMVTQLEGSAGKKPVTPRCVRSRILLRNRRRGIDRWS